MTDRRLILILICILFIAVVFLSFYLFKDILSNGSSVSVHGQQGEYQNTSSSMPGENSGTNNPAGNNNDIRPTNQPTPSSSENSTENNDLVAEGVSVTPVASKNTAGSEGENSGSDVKNILATPTPIPPKNMLNVLFLGIDRTEAREATRISSAADTIMLARVNLDNKTMKVLSIPRDTYAYIPIADKMDKINSSYSYGAQQGKAMKNIKDAILGLLGESCKIDYYFTLDMEPVPDIIDDLGGVKVNVELDMQSHGVNLSKGLQLLDGKSAYDYIRWRYADDGDIGRVRRQQGFIKAMFSKLQSSNMEKDLLRIILSYGDYINSDLGLEQIDNIIKLCAGISDEDIQFYVLPGEGQTMDEVSYWMIDEEKAKQVIEEFLN